jgi:hypothetical protein
VSIKSTYMIDNPWAYTLWVVDHRKWESESRALHAGSCPGPTTGALDGAVRGFVFGVAARNLSQVV